MSNFDDIFEGNASRKGQLNQPFDKEAWAEKKQAERQAVYGLADTIAEAQTAVNFRRIWMCRPVSAVILPPMCY